MRRENIVKMSGKAMLPTACRVRQECDLLRVEALQGGLQMASYDVPLKILVVSKF